ncbi:hypothetical protein GCM10025772_24070 [Ferrimonas gelatinilytica]|uniref:Uncharacterized protein n=1 Tax=Ferrimonas gelatinilytica TaxID=1255257 RepID=A0ABP9SCQ0_9GAMM
MPMQNKCRPYAFGAWVNGMKFDSERYKNLAISPFYLAYWGLNANRLARKPSDARPDSGR